MAWMALALGLATIPLAAAGTPLEAFRGATGTIDIAGGTAHIPVMNEAAKQIMTAYPKVRITVAGGGSGVGVEKVAAGLVAIGNTGRPLSKQEAERHGLISFPFAIDGVAVIIHPKNPVSDLSAEQIRKIFAGQTTNWKAVGGQDAPINLYTRDEASGTRAVLWKKLLKKGLIAEHADVVTSNGAMKVAAAQDPNAIGYAGIGHIDSTVKAPLLDGIAPTQENAAAGHYPIVRKLYMNTKGEPSPLVRAFIDYILGPAGAKIIKSKGYIPLVAG
ncbi:MAG: phosphate ABC transporter substrate-binding protein [Candidatus Eisenbacteria sp.]|nr:phosphate ABC transporter substrate-binding protein [Candidatus Eisenbacteria bacterium]